MFPRQIHQLLVSLESSNSDRLARYLISRGVAHVSIVLCPKQKSQVSDVAFHFVMDFAVRSAFAARGSFVRAYFHYHLPNRHRSIDGDAGAVHIVGTKDSEHSRHYEQVIAFAHQ